MIAARVVLDDDGVGDRQQQGGCDALDERPTHEQHLKVPANTRKERPDAVDRKRRQEEPPGVDGRSERSTGDDERGHHH